MCAKFMPYQLAISVGSASRPAQPASFLTISPCATVTSDRLTFIAAETISRWVSMVSRTRAAWSSTSRKYGRTSSGIRIAGLRISCERMSCIGATASRIRVSSLRSSYSLRMVPRL